MVKFQKKNNNKLYSGVAQPKFDSIKGMGWKIHFSKIGGIETKIFYRKDLGDSLLELLKKLREDVKQQTSKTLKTTSHSKKHG